MHDESLNVGFRKVNRVGISLKVYEPVLIVEVSQTKVGLLQVEATALLN